MPTATKRRTLTPAPAVKAGATVLVVGTLITQVPADRIVPRGQVLVQFPVSLTPGEHQEISVPLEAIALP